MRRVDRRLVVVVVMKAREIVLRRGVVAVKILTRRAVVVVVEFRRVTSSPAPPAPTPVPPDEIAFRIVIGLNGCRRSTSCGLALGPCTGVAAQRDWRRPRCGRWSARGRGIPIPGPIHRKPPQRRRRGRQPTGGEGGAPAPGASLGLACAIMNSAGASGLAKFADDHNGFEIT